jgi:hypothetical protein
MLHQFLIIGSLGALIASPRRRSASDLGGAEDVRIEHADVDAHLTLGIRHRALPPHDAATILAVDEGEFLATPGIPPEHIGAA